MTRKHFEAVAAVLDGARQDADEDLRPDVALALHRLLDDVTYDLAHCFHMENERFDSARFFAAAGMRDVAVDERKGVR